MQWLRSSFGAEKIAHMFQTEASSISDGGETCYLSLLLSDHQLAEHVARAEHVGEGDLVRVPSAWSEHIDAPEIKVNSLSSSV